MRILLLASAAMLLSACSTLGITRDTSDDRKMSYIAAPEALKTWVDARAGTGEPVHWVSEGGVYDYPSGKKVFGMIGFDSSIVIWPDKPGDEIIHLTRKTFAYTDPDTGEVITEYKGKKVEPIAYPYQMITYRYENDIIYGDVEQGVKPRIQKIKSTDGIRVRKMGDTYAYTASVFLDFPLPNGDQYQAWENYDFFIHPQGSVEEPEQMSWQRYGSMPKWAGSTPAIYHLLSWRVEEQSEFPPKLIEWARREKPNWLTPPASVEEVRALQDGTAGPGWGQ